MLGVPATLGGGHLETTQWQELVEEMAQAVADELGLQLVAVEVGKWSGRLLLRVVIYRADGVSHRDCMQVSEELGKRLDVADPIPSQYYLEVSSPGLDRVLRSDREYRIFAGRRVKVRTYGPVQGRREFAGTLLGLGEGTVRLLTDQGEEIGVPRQQVAKVRLAEGPQDEEARRP